MTIALMFVMAAVFAIAAAKTLTFATSISVGGSNTVYQQNVVASGNNDVGSAPSVPAAKTGVLTVRTNATSGTLTMDPGHGFTTAADVSLFWSGGSRSGVTLGTVSVNSVPFSGGTGDDLPAAATAITAMIPTSEVFVATGDNATGILVFGVLQPSDGDAFVEFLSSGPAILATYELAGSSPSDGWNGTGTNPLAGVTVATVRFSHGQTAARNMGATVLYN